MSEPADAHRWKLTAELGAAWARVAEENVCTEYPHKLDHLIRDQHDLLAPRVLHPAFYGAYDWHSAVHMHWTLARLLRRFPAGEFAGSIADLLDRHINATTIAQELAYLSQPERETFERPYGWAWLLKLQAELHLLAASCPADKNAAHWHAADWCKALRPLAEVFREKFMAFLAKSDFPVRAGTHGNSAFAMLLAHDYAQAMQDRTLIHAIAAKANQWFGRDRNYPAAYEPGGSDFLSAGLCEAVLMSRVVDGCSFFDWWQLFRPVDSGLAAWLLPVSVSDRADPQIGHLAGLNLSRAWCWRLLSVQQESLAADISAGVIDRAVAAHLDASMPHIAGGDFSATHWLASFALLALDDC